MTSLIDGIKCVRLDKTCEYPAGRKPYGSSTPEDAQSADSTTSLESSGYVLPCPESSGYLLPAPDSSGCLLASAESSGYMLVPTFPDAFFLDTELFSPVSHSSFRSGHSVPAHISQLLGADANAICEPYFSSIDAWFPFVSRKRLNQGIQASLPTETPGLALLLLCMKLVTDVPQLSNIPAVESTLYRASRDYLNTMEEASPMSLHVFQSLVLIALYEIGHGIFPAAYLTVGRAARLGLLRGVHDRKNSTQLFQTPQTWTYWEEERRIWWAVSILER